MFSARSEEKMRLALLLLLFLLSSCSASDPDYASQQAARIEHPDIRLENAVCTLNEHGSTPVTLRAGEITYWTDEERMEAADVSFSQPDSEGQSDISGSAQHARIDTGNEIMYLTGDVRLESISSDLSIQTSSLIFDIRNQRVDSQDYVSVTFSDGSLTGRALSADLRSMQLDLLELEQGEVII